MDKFLYKLALPAVESHDVVKRELYVLVDGVETVHEISDPKQTHFDLVFEQDQEVSVYLVDIDDAGNRSEGGEILDFTVIDTVPPVAPKAPVVSEVVEYFEPVVEEPVVEGDATA